MPGEVECRRNLRLLHEALVRYRTDYSEYPDRLSDLIPQYLADERYLSCPLTRRSGDPRLGLRDVRSNADFRDRAGYIYEWSRHPIGKDLWKDGNWTQRDYKRAQAILIGDRVPLVRCGRRHGSDRWLNLSIGGDIFTSGLLWEVEFLDRFTGPQMHPAWVFSGLLPLEPRIPNVSAPPTECVSLTGYMNGLPVDSWTGDAPGEPAHLRALGGPIVRLPNLNLQFDCRALIQLNGAHYSPPEFPVARTGIRVHRAGHEICLLHGVIGGETNDAPVAEFVVHFSDARTSRISIHYGRDVVDWRYDEGGSSTDRVIPAWTAVNPALPAGARGQRLFLTRWQNPQPGTVVQTVDFVSFAGKSAPFLVGLTVTP